MNELEKAPDFEAIDDKGNKFRLKEALGKYIVLYFYPRAMTAGCTKEAIRFNELYEEFKGINAEVFGISTDKVEKIRKFSEKYGLRFRLLSDPEAKVAEAYKVKKQGKNSAERVTYIISPNGTIISVLKGIRPAEAHADLSLEFLKKANKKGSK
ncbi:MAG: peroxiredoxin [Caldisphaeraceae archaeon]|nr:peroxiredoxin [Caldisphaeraceae archaeon]